MANDVNFTIGADTKAAERSIDSLQNSLKNLNKIAVAAVAVFAGKQVLDFFNQGIDGAVAQEQAMASLAQQLKATGEFSTKALEQFAAFGDEMEKTSKFSDDVVISQVAVAKAMGLTNKQSQDLVKASIELSSATGDSLASSVEQLGKTYDGVSGKSPVLKNALKGLSKEALEAGKGIEAVQKAFGGSAAAQIQTYAGAIKQAQNSFGNFQEAFGKIIIENPQLLAAIQVVRESFVKLEEIVKDNADTISAFISTGITLLFEGLSNLTPVLKGVILALEGFATVMSLAFTGAVEGVKFLAEVWAASYGVMIESVLQLTDKLGLTENASAGFKTFIDDAITGLDELSTKSTEFTAKNIESFAEFNKGFDKFSEVIDKAAKSVSEADKKTAEFALASKKAQEQSELAAKKAAETKAKALEGLSVLQKRIELETADQFKKLEIARDKDLKDLEKYEKDSGGASSRTNEIRKKILDQYSKSYSEALLDLRSAEDKYHKESLNAAQEASDRQKKEIEDRQKEISTILQNTNIFQQIKLSLAPNAASDLKSEITKNLGAIAANVGATIVSGVANGASGAASVADTVANLISKIPVVGGLIAELVKLAGQAPEENKKNIQGFVKGIPQFLENVNVNLGALNGILNEVIGPIIKKIIDEVGIFDLLSKLGQNLVSLPALIKTIALGVRDGLRGSGGELSDAFKKGIADTKAEIGRFAETVRNFFSTFGNQLRSAFDFVFKNNPLLNELKSMKELMARLTLVVEFISTLFQSIPGAFVQIRDTINGITEKFNGAFENLGAKFTDGFLQVRDQIASLFSGVADAFKQFPGQIRDALSDLFNGLKEAIQNAFSGDKLKPATGKLGGSGGLKLPKFATGITEVPSGFENDGFLARLSSGERVVDKNSNQDLKDFLANSRAGGLGSDQMIALLSEISSKLNNSGSQTIEVTVDKKVLGRTILDLNRRNERINA